MSSSEPTPSSAIAPASLESAYLRHLHQVTESLARAQTGDDVAEVIASLIAPMMETEKGILVLLTADGQSLRVVRSVGLSAEDVEDWQHFSVDAHMPLAEAVRNMTPVFVASPAEAHQRYLSLLALPLLVETKAIGAIGLAFTVARYFTTDEIAFLGIVAQQCAVTLERVRFIEQEQKARLVLETRQRQLEDSERQWRSLAESIPHLVWSARADGYSDYWNAQLLEYLGKSDEDVRGWNWLTSVHPDDHDRSVTAWTDAFQTGSEYRIEQRVRRAADGEYRWFQVHALPLRDQNGQIVRWYGTCTDIHERKIAEEQAQAAKERLEKLAATDGLTGIKNHRAFQEELAEEWEYSRRYKTPLALLLLDVDMFKKYNDTFGHPSGDEVLKRVADVLRQCARACDVVARYGGDEFAVILPNTAEEGAWEAAERFRSTVESLTWERDAVTISVGICAMRPTMEAPSELVEEADKALYLSKHKGRNCIGAISTPP